MSDGLSRIIGIGNVFCKGDSVGPAVCDYLRNVSLPDNVEVIDGGLGGLDLLPFLDDVDRVVFVDAGKGFDNQDSPLVILSAEEAAQNSSSHFGHDAGLMYLLRVLPNLMELNQPEIYVLCVSGPINTVLIKTVASQALKLALGQMSDATCR